MSGSCLQCLRHFFCWLNVLFWVIGCGILGIGLWLRIAYEGYATLLPHYAYLSADSLAIAIGVLTIVLSFLACCGSWFKSKYLLIVYFGAVLFLIIVQFTIGCMSLIFQHYVEHSLREELVYGISRHYNVTAQGPNSLIEVWDHIQTEFRCCGVNGYEDWYMIDSWPTEKWVPDTCCLPANEEDGCGRVENADYFYTHGCYDKILLWVMERLIVVESVVLVVAFIQLSGLIISMLLFCTVRHKMNSSRMYKTYK